MKIVQVTYTAKPEYTAQNKENIQTVMKDLRKAGHPGINYHVCLSADGKTFIHRSFFLSDQDQQLLNDLPSFRYFQEQLKSRGLETPPKQELLSLVGSSVDIFNA